MSNKNERRKEQLGMPYGTASGRLRKMILFKLLIELEMHQCYACGEEIGSVEELSIEHIEPWEGRPNGAEKFWDLDNIAFSHRACNIPHVYHKSVPEGKAWCCGCQDYLDTDEFSKTSSRNGVRTWCKKCRSRRKKEGKVY